MATEKAHETGLAGRYANAVFELAQEQGVVDAVAADFKCRWKPRPSVHSGERGMRP